MNTVWIQLGYKSNKNNDNEINLVTTC